MYFVEFLFDSHECAVAEGSVSSTPTGRRPADLFQWKVTSGTNGEVSVRGFAMEGTTLIGTARWEGRVLGGFRQSERQVPSDPRWTSIEEFLTSAIAERATRGDPDDVDLIDPISRSERRRLYDRTKTNWQRMGDRYDRHGNDRYFMRKATMVIVAFLLASCVAVIATVWCRSRAMYARATRSRPPTPAATAPPAPERSPTLADRISASATFAEAVTLARGDPSGVLLAHFGGAQWSDVAVPPETSIARVQKDPASEYGKRMCIDGAIERITRRDVATGKRFSGRLVRTDGDAIEFLALGTTGDLVRRSAATLCGVVVGLRDDAPVVVGLFDLPENRTPLVEK